MRILVTGATGFIGQNFIHHMQREGHEVHAIVRQRPNFPAYLDKITVHKYTGHGQEILNAVEKSRPEVVVHLASLFLAENKFEQISALCESNISFGTQLVEAMVENKCLRLVCAGTAWQNFNEKKGTATNLYAATKEAFEVILRYYADAQGIKAVVLKLNDTYGPGDTRRKLLAILREATLKKETLGMSPGDQKMDLLHVLDVVEALKVAVARTEKGSIGGVEEFYLRSGRLVTLKELVDLFTRASGKPLQVQFGARKYRVREVMHPWSEGDVLPDWKPQVTLETGLHEFANEE